MPGQDIVSFDEGMGICSGKTARVQGGKASRVGKGGVLVSGSAAGTGAVGPVPWRGGEGIPDQDHGRRIGWFRAGGYLQARSLASVTADAETVRQWPGQETRGSPAFPDLSKLTVVGWCAAYGGRAPAEPDARGRGPPAGWPYHMCPAACLPAYLPGSVYISFNNNNK